MDSARYWQNDGQAEAANFVRNEVHYCVSYMISQLAGSVEACALLDVDYDDLLDVCGGADTEVFEHWIVTPWLAGKLREHDELVIDDVLGIGPIWGRQTSGQAIHMDLVICEILAELHTQ